MQHSTRTVAALLIASPLFLGACSAGGAQTESPSPSASAEAAATILDAVRLDDAVQVQSFLDAGTDPNTEVDGVPLLHVAALGDYGEAAQALIAGGADLNVRYGAAGSTPLIVAAESPGTEVLTVLLDAGADISLGETTGPAAGPLQAAARGGNVEAMEILVASGMGVDDKGPAKSTALIWAAYYGQLEAVEYLIDNGADLTEVDVAGQDALRNAEIAGFPEVADFIRAAMEAQGLL